MPYRAPLSEYRFLLEHIKTAGELVPEVVYHVATFFESQPDFAKLTTEQRVIAAMIAIEYWRSQQGA